MSVGIKYVTLIIAVFALNQELIITPHLSDFSYYAMMIFGFILLLLKSKNIYFNVLLVLFIIIAIYSLLINQIPHIFKAPQRLIAFVIVSGFVGPLISSEFCYAVRQNIFIFTNRLLIITVCISCLTYFLNINIPGTILWGGIFISSMTIGPLAGIALLVLLYLIHSDSYKINKGLQKLLIITGLLLSFIALLLASSRAAILGLITGVVFFYYKLYQQRLLKFLSVILVTSLAILVTFPLWSEYTGGIKEKNIAAEGDLVASRREIWQYRTEEFLTSPILGIGFATANLMAFGVNADTGEIEPGSSWMSILSMVGILGLIPIVFLFLYFIRYLVRNNENCAENAVLGGILFLFVTHMFAEGYFLFSGSFLFFYIWLLLGMIDGYGKYKHVRVI